MKRANIIHAVEVVYPMQDFLVAKLLIHPIIMRKNNMDQLIYLVEDLYEGLLVLLALSLYSNIAIVASQHHKGRTVLMTPPVHAPSNPQCLTSVAPSAHMDACIFYL